MNNSGTETENQMDTWYVYIYIYMCIYICIHIFLYTYIYNMGSMVSMWGHSFQKRHRIWRTAFCK